jgi:phosphoribosylglycinamide formyltransferase-1
VSTTSRAIAVFASGNGSNLQAIIDAIAHKKLDARIAVVVSDTPGAHALARAATHQIPTLLLPAQAGEKKEVYAARVAAALAPYGVTLICLAGFMRLLGKALLDAYPNRIINIHPSLLPAYPGLHVIKRAFDDRVAETGCTIHYVDAGVDTGPVIAQTRVAIRKEDTVDSLTERIHTAEHALYPATIQKVLDQLCAS